MQIEKLKDYLNGAMSYLEACSIFVLVAKNKVLATNLLRRDTVSNREKLAYEIKKMLSESKVNVSPTPKSIEVKSIINPVFISPTASKEISPIHAKILEERKRLYSERGHFHGRLHEAETDEARCEIAKQIVEIQPKIDELNRDLRSIEQGEIPVKYLQTKATAEEYIEIRNTKQYIARYTKQLSTASPDEKIRLEKLIEKYKSKLSNL